jgi:hypothetical protein
LWLENVRLQIVHNVWKTKPNKKINKTRFQNVTYKIVVICGIFKDAVSSSGCTELKGKQLVNAEMERM